jgi:hypothetical protein
MPTRKLQVQPRPILATTRLAADLDAIAKSAGDPSSRWASARLTEEGIDDITELAGVYCFTMPKASLPKKRSLILHGRTFGSRGSRSQLRVEFAYEAQQFGNHSGLVLYVGKAARLRARIKGHLSTHPRATTNQVLRGLVAGSHAKASRISLSNALTTLRAHGQVHFYEHCHPSESRDLRGLDEAGECFVAERDLLEIKLIARFAPPFNIKAER